MHNQYRYLFRCYRSLEIRGRLEIEDFRNALQVAYSFSMISIEITIERFLTVVLIFQANIAGRSADNT